MTTILKIETSYETLMIRFQIKPRKRKAGSSIITEIIQALISENMSTEVDIPSDWVYKSTIALEKEGHSVEYFQIRYKRGNVNIAAFTSGRSDKFRDSLLNEKSRLKRLIIGQETPKTALLEIAPPYSHPN